MAQSPAHRFGQIIGEVLETGITRVLEKFARKHGLYLDGKGSRPCRRGKKCSWVDHNGNVHDLDFVLERGGSLQQVGTPVAFIEAAWRRYTKHSRNKVQEIQGAIEPLAETYRSARPFKGAVLAGVFTEGALAQLGSLGFTVLYFPYDSVVSTFRRFGIDAMFDEDTPDAEFQKRVDAYERLGETAQRQLAARLVQPRQANLIQFLKSLVDSVSRQIERIIILALHGGSREVTTLADAIRFIEGYTDDGRRKPIERFEIEVRYGNGDVVKGTYRDKAAAIEFLKTYQPAPPKVV